MTSVLSIWVYDKSSQGFCGIIGIIGGADAELFIIDTIGLDYIIDLIGILHFISSRLRSTI